MRHSAASSALPPPTMSASASPPPDTPPSPLSPPSSASLSSLASQAPRPRVEALKDLLDRVLRVHCSDGRVFIGTFVCTDKALNIVLSNTDEFRIGASGEGRYVTMVMVPWRLVVSVGAYDNRTCLAQSSPRLRC